MNILIHKAEDRGSANHGWLKAMHSFSFANYYHPEKMNFGVLRVLNEDIVAPGAGFGEHPHDNMEIITIPLAGSVRHRDSMGNDMLIKSGELQVMSAGKGIFHSEFNSSEDDELNLFQIWIIPNKRNVEPRYDQISIGEFEVKNAFYQIVSPDMTDQGAWIHQNAWLSMGHFDKGSLGEYLVKDKNNGAYLIVIEGEVEIEGNVLKKRDAIGISNTDQFELKSNGLSKVLVIDVPMNV